MDTAHIDVIRFRLPRGIDPDVALTRLRVVLRPRSSQGSVTVVRSGDRRGRLVLLDVDPERAQLVLMCISVRGGDQPR
jgi:hypothetical protein